ncbi:efflux RND transporter periplasmic adaptor subunit [Herbaspirillum sp. SJZ107]|uniref:efflux RND transporter periplasmic adaptor subunit n=1 Tax=Herbaspirillum sp. SJZ107 TaxID=2572881 RepID=UPI001153251F|nr:HlyD family efflux transporter periplasmic adaptor subunit [Herbaspirillum sp. SJZ107]TQK08098.1 HlyD family secretion protein [Herbaspirillum sp. SJZ107]
MDQAIPIDTLRRRRLHHLAGAACLFAAMCAGAWGLNRVLRPSVDAGAIVVSEARYGDVDNTINAAGVVIPVHEEVVASPGASRVARVHAKPGQQVRQGDLLLELDDRAIRLALEALKEQLAQQDNRVATLGVEMDQKLKQTRSSIELLEIDLQAARVRHERNQKLRASGLVSGEDLLTAELNVRRTEIQLRQQRELVEDTRRATAGGVAAAKLQQAILHKQIAQQEQLLAQTRVCAPFAGMLTWVLEEEGASVAAGQLVARVSELNNYRVEASLSDFHARLLAAGQPVRVEQNGEILAGTVHTILPEIQNGSIKLLVDLASPRNPNLRNKMRVDVNVVTAHRAQVLVLDNGAAFNGRGRQPAFAVRDGVARKTMLELGASDGKVIEVAAGARPGDRFIVSDTGAFKDLDSIRIAN